MATYKVLQDIEAEDKLLGPLTLRQFIYAIIAAVCGYFCFLGLAKGVPFLLLPFFPIMALFGFLAFPWGRDQPTEVWALAKVRFLLLPRKRIWDQSGTKQLVTVTAPKKIDTNYTDNLSQTEVKSRLLALADTLDSRGWAVKNISPTDVRIMQATAVQSDRLVDLASSPLPVPDQTFAPQEDMFDSTSETASHFDQMITTAAANHRAQLISQMQSGSQSQPAAPAGQATPPDNFWFMNQSGAAGATDAAVIAPGTEPTRGKDNTDDFLLAEQIKANKKTPQIANMHMHNIAPPSVTGPKQPSTSVTTDDAAQPANDSAATIASSTASQPSQTDDNQTANGRIEQARRAAEWAQLARNNDLDIATISRQADKTSNNDEVVVSLH